MKHLITIAFVLILCASCAPADKPFTVEYKVHYPDTCITKYYHFMGTSTAMVFIRCGRSNSLYFRRRYPGTPYFIEQSLCPFEVVALKEEE